LKAVVARGTKEVTIVDKEAAQKFVVAHMKTLKALNPNNGMSPIQRQQKYGTSFNTYNSAHSGDAPVKNWGGWEW